MFRRQCFFRLHCTLMELRIKLLSFSQGYGSRLLWKSTVILKAYLCGMARYANMNHNAGEKKCSSQDSKHCFIKKQLYMIVTVSIECATALLKLVVLALIESNIFCLYRGYLHFFRLFLTKRKKKKKTKKSSTFNAGQQN